MIDNTVYKLLISFAYLAPSNKTLYQNLNHFKRPFCTSRLQHLNKPDAYLYRKKNYSLETPKRVGK
jgi:hypothetical protein